MSSNYLSKIRDFFSKKIKINGLNPNSYQPLWGFEVSRLTMFSLLFVFFLMFFGLSFVIIGYTPVQSLLPDNVRNTDRALLENQYMKIDSLIVQIEYQERYISDIKKIILGEELSTDFVTDTMTNLNTSQVEIQDKLSESEIALANKVQEEINENRGFVTSGEKFSGVFFFSPVTGIVSQKMSDGHPGIDIITAEKEAVKSILEGVVIFSDWTNKDGKTIIINHDNKFISLYKHNSILLKKAGDKVKAGDPIAIVGNTGENSTGPHLHFELIFEGKYVNPLNYISFK